MTRLIPYTDEADAMCSLIQSFWLAHNGYAQPVEEAQADLAAWTADGHALYFIQENEQSVGFLHLGSRGGEPDWLEDIFVLPSCQGFGIGSRAIGLAEQIVRQYSSCLYIEAAARNADAIRLYHRLGYATLNTITLRRDFASSPTASGATAALHNLTFDIRE